MEYQVTATRLRPQKFEDLLGQEFVAATLQKSIEAGKIAHAYLFSGPRGCGKTSSARILAKVINCIEGPSPSPCGKCIACQEITTGSCLDVIEIDGASNTSVNDVRQIKDEILFPPNSNRYKVYIIDEVHMLSTSAFNALLKTIEEPPPYVVFIFATTEIHKVPATIKSRCQQFNFKLVSVDILKEALAKACDSLNIKADDEALYWIAREATGSVRDAYTLFDQVAAFSDGYITFEKIHEKLGLTGIDSINKLVLACTQKNAHEALNIIDGILQNGISVEQVVLDCADYFRSLLLIKHGITKEALIGQRADRFPAEIFDVWGSIQIEQALSIMLQLFKDIRFSIDPRYELELAVSRISWLVDFISPENLKKAYDAAKNILARGSNSMMPKVNHSQGMNSQSFNKADSLTNQFKAALRNETKLDTTITENSNKNITESIVQDQVIVQPKIEQTTSAQAIRNFDEEKSTKQIFSIDDLDEFKENIVKTLSKKNALLSSALEQSKDWEIKKDILFIFAKSNFDFSLIEKQITLIREIVEKISGQKYQVIVKEFVAQQDPDGKIEIKNEYPEIINLLLDVFMGEVVEKSLIDNSEILEQDNQDIA